MDNCIYIDLLLGMELFSGLAKKDLIHLFGLSDHGIEHYDKGQIVHIQNEVCLSMDVILQGRLSVQKINEEGNVLKVAEFTAGDTIGANLLFATDNAYPMTIMAESDATILRVPRELVLAFSQQSSSFTAALLAEVSNKALILTGKIDTLSFKTIRQRIMDYLHYQYHIQRSDVIKLDMSKKDLAEKFGVHRTSLSRELSKMRADGLIEFDAQTITIKGAHFQTGMPKNPH
jgi:CRP-like cAMP-binding protein